MSNAPDVLFGLVPLIRAIVRSSTTAANVTITPDDSGTLFVNLATNAAITYTLPSVTDCAGKCFAFFNGQTSKATIVTGGTDYGKMMADDHADYDYVTSAEEVGECCLVMGDGTYVYVLPIHGTWTAST